MGLIRAGRGSLHALILGSPAAAARALKDALHTPTIQGLAAALKEAKGRVDAAARKLDEERLREHEREVEARVKAQWEGGSLGCVVACVVVPEKWR